MILYFFFLSEKCILFTGKRPRLIIGICYIIYIHRYNLLNQTVPVHIYRYLTIYVNKRIYYNIIMRRNIFKSIIQYVFNFVFYVILFNIN